MTAATRECQNPHLTWGILRFVPVTSGIPRKLRGLPFKPYKIFHSGKSDGQTRRQDVITEFFFTASLVTPPFCDVFRLNHVFDLLTLLYFSMQCDLRYSFLNSTFFLLLQPPHLKFFYGPTCEEPLVSKLGGLQWNLEKNRTSKPRP